jgi:Ca-activated chloride channel family protein
VVSKLNEAGLQEVATTTNGIYTRLETTEEAVNLLKKQLSGIEKTAFTDVSQMNFINYYIWLAALMLLLLLVDIFISERKKVRV